MLNLLDEQSLFVEYVDVATDAVVVVSKAAHFGALVVVVLVGSAQDPGEEQDQGENGGSHHVWPMQ